MAQEERSAAIDSAATPAPRRREATHPSTSFWRELWEFTVICLCGWIVALLLLPPRLEERRLLERVDAKVAAEVIGLERTKETYEAAILAVEGDPFYRDEIFRAVLGVKKNGEEFLQEPAPDFR